MKIWLTVWLFGSTPLCPSAHQLRGQHLPGCIYFCPVEDCLYSTFFLNTINQTLCKTLLLISLFLPSISGLVATLWWFLGCWIQFLKKLHNRIERWWKTEHKALRICVIERENYKSFLLRILIVFTCLITMHSSSII